jgi:hypothetical protein
LGIFPKINKHGGSNNRVGGRISQKLINVEVLIRHVLGKIFSKRIRKTPCLLESSEYKILQEMNLFKLMTLSKYMNSK